ncbi:MAG: squalene synthase HpnC [Acidobacteria bacterium]|nr:squalene synthase HpnC [Acidobacteriota bacterium]
MTTATSPRLAGSPHGYEEPPVRPSLAEARAYCKALAESHYENFHVATAFLPARVRPHFHAIYCYCRLSDDLGDEVHDPQLALHLLDEWEQMMHEMYDAPERVKHPVLVALAETVRECDIPREPFAKLLIAFRQDQTKLTHTNMQELVEYSKSSANPVGQLVLYVSGYRDPQLHAYSDSICTGLQLANFWQDVGEDLRERNRIYIPQDAMERFGVTREQMERGETTPQYRTMLADLCSQARQMLNDGALLEQRVDKELASTLWLFRNGGLSILDAIAAIDYDTLNRRPVVTKQRKAALLLGALWRRLLSLITPWRGA